MTIPSQLDNKILARFDELINRTKQLTNQHGSRAGMDSLEPSGRIEFTELQTNIETLIDLLFGQSDRATRLVADVSRKASTRLGAEGLLGILGGLKSDYQAGLLQHLSQIIEANIAADYMEQAEQLLGEGIAGQYDHVPAAVLTGAVLEDALRRLCQRQTPPIDTDLLDNNGQPHPKKMNILIDDLKRAGLYNEIKAKQLRSWAAIRNAAAHGKFGEFKREDVEQMMASIQTFLAEYL